MHDYKRYVLLKRTHTYETKTSDQSQTVFCWLKYVVEWYCWVRKHENTARKNISKIIIVSHFIIFICLLVVQYLSLNTISMVLIIIWAWILLLDNHCIQLKLWSFIIVHTCTANLNKEASARKKVYVVAWVWGCRMIYVYIWKKQTQLSMEIPAFSSKKVKLLAKQR